MGKQRFLELELENKCAAVIYTLCLKGDPQYLPMNYFNLYCRKIISSFLSEICGDMWGWCRLGTHIMGVLRSA